jgi:hypothetical protein
MSTRAPVHEPTLAHVLEQAIMSVLGSVHTAFPGQINKYDYTKAEADIKPLLSKKYDDGTIAEMPIIPSVPIVWPRTSLGSISFPLQRGDCCLVICSERSLDKWLSKGGIVINEDTRKFDLTDAIAIPGLYSFATPTKILNNEDFLITFKDQTIKIKQGGNIEIGNGMLTIFDGIVTKKCLCSFTGIAHPDASSQVLAVK